MMRRANLSLVIVAVLGLLALCGSAQAVKCSGPFHGMISYWKFDEGSGTAAYDWVGDNHGIVYGAIWTTGQVDGALSFDGVNDYLFVEDADTLDVTDGITITAWIKAHDFTGDGSRNGNPIVTKWQTRQIGQYHLSAYTGGNIAFRIADGISSDNLVATNILATSRWCHIAAWWNGNSMRIFVDGDLISEKGTSITTLYEQDYDEDYLQIGHDTGGEYPYWWFNGTIDEVAIYNRALSAEEIQQLYQIGLSGYGLPVDLIIAINNIEDAIAEKLEMLEKIDATLEKEWAAYEALEELLESGDYGDLNKGDIVTAKQKIHSAIQHEEQSKKALEKSIEKLEDSLWFLGCEVDTQNLPEPYTEVGANEVERDDN